MLSPLVTDEAEHENRFRLVDTFGQFPTSSGQSVLADIVAGKVLWREFQRGIGITGSSYTESVSDVCRTHLTAEEELTGNAVCSVEGKRVVFAPNLAQ